MSKSEIYAVIQLVGKQYLVRQGDTFEVSKLEGEDGETVAISDVLLIGGETVKVGAPLVDGASVTLKIVEQGRDKKLRVAVYKAKSRYRKVKGHRQHKSLVEVVKISA